MVRLSAALLSIALLASMPAPASAMPINPSPVPAAAEAPIGPTVMPPATPAVAPLIEVAITSDLTRVGRLRIRGIRLDVPVYRWSCRNTDLPNRALRWKCSGANNQFIVGHAYGVFHPYYLAWKYDRFTKGMRARFTDANGKVTRYALKWARKVPANYVWHGKTGDQWAWNATATPSITLQTCWGATNKYRIVARWVKI
jgi:hypothetical protein